MVHTGLLRMSVPLQCIEVVRVGISSINSDCIVIDFGVVSAFGIGLAGVLSMGFLGVFVGEDFPVTLGNLDFD